MKNRKSNFELLRLVAMMLVLLVHANYLSLGPITQSETVAMPWTGFVRILCEQLCIISVNLFVLLSGWFGIHPTLKKFFGLLFQVMFIGLVSSMMCKLAGFDVPVRPFQHLMWFGQHYWFVPAYFILFALSPVLNAFCEKANKREFTAVIISFFVMEALFGWLNGDNGHYLDGYSAISFIGLYLLAQFLRRYGEKLLTLKWWHFFLFYLLFTIIPALMAFVGVYIKNEQYSAIDYSSLLVIAASVSFMLMFSRFKLECKWVNWLSASAFAIYLVHQAPGVDQLYLDFFKESYQSMHGVLFVPFAVVATAIIGFICILLDKLRIAVWSGILIVVEKVRCRIVKQ